MGQKKKGVIKAVKKGFGFIKVKDEPDVHFNFDKFVPRVEAIRIKQGLEVSFELGKGRGDQMTAVNIRILDDSISDIPESRKQDDNMPEYFLPSDTSEIIDKNMRRQIDNFHLLLNKCAQYDARQETFILFRKGDKKDSSYQITADFSEIPLQDIVTRHRNAIHSLTSEGLAGPIVLSVDWRMVVGFGNESVYETSMTLHHIYGIPYIPGQAVKGVVRNCMISEKYGCEEAALNNHEFCDIFGCPAESVYKKARQGNVIFFDAFPLSLSPRAIQIDIMNPHYGPYYGEGKPPADYHNPVPVNFLTVKATKFEFYMGIRKSRNTEIRQSSDLLNTAEKYLKETLAQHGIGAKTAAGYGFFS
ncbi:MAG: type III-B CRISPR module RAMP protein Cmr6 [Desulfobacteraceae bacterium]|nr:type III-B CRISPR module RAMP protein Cmr6 [Desulfobacteraceae bacterium]